jgi:hypothetical protein
VIFASCSSYVLGQLTTPKEAVSILQTAIANPDVPMPVPAIEPLRWLRDFDEVAYSVNGGGTHIAKTRSREFHAAYESKAALWFTIDDDVTMTKETLGWLLKLAVAPSPVIAMAPCVLRGTDMANVAWAPILVETLIPGGGKARRFEHGGFGAVVMNRQAMQVIHKHSPAFVDDDGVEKRAPFVERFDQKRWYGEDVSFYKGLPRDVDRWALVTGQTTHAGATIDLSTLT